MFPQGRLLRPAARKTASSMVTVVVLPLVPVTATAGLRRASAPSSISPITRFFCRRKRSGSG